jgi:nucleotide-binding universal stress UspA family protein
MPIKEILLPLVGDPDPAAIAAIEKCVAMARDIGARISALAIEVDIPVRPKVIVSDDLDNTEATEAARSVSNARDLLKAFNAAATRSGTRNEQQLRRSAAAEIAATLAEAARLNDLSLVPLKRHDAQGEKIIEQLIFHSGRPVMLCPEEFAEKLPTAFDTVTIAWDHSAPAARAIADAMPLLQAAANVRIITASDEKSAAELASGTALVNHLAVHGIMASFEMVGIGGSSVGKVFERYVNANAVDLLVMGAYRHSRLNQFFWGGASNTIIGRPPCWVMMSH